MPYLRVKNELPLIPGYASGDSAIINDACSGAPVNKMAVGIIDHTGVTGCTVACNGINQWNEEWELGIINSTTGEDEPNSSYIRSKGYIPVIVTNVYCETSASLRLVFYDKDKEFIGIAHGNNSVVSLPDNTRYLRFYVNNSFYGTKYKNDISINYPSTDTDYHAYVGSQYDLDWTSEVGSVTYGSFVIDKDGAVTVTSRGSDTPIADTAPLTTHSGVNYIICTAGTIQNITYIRRLDS